MELCPGYSSLCVWGKSGDCVTLPLGTWLLHVRISHIPPNREGGIANQSEVVSPAPTNRIISDKVGESQH